ncbi:MAG: hypothetical protein DMG24_05015 [Acidobacteria bacterium]|nr:MAG: hypothetical protein DMG24_05015 [Acidobacteriota bacterium]
MGLRKGRTRMVCNLGRRDRGVRIAVGALIAVAAFPLRTHALMAIALLVTGLAFMVGAAVGY